MFNKDVFQIRLRELRENKGLSARKLASLMGLSQSAIGQFERGTTLPALDTLVAMSNYFGVTTDYLLGVTDFPYAIPEKILSIIDKTANPDELMKTIQEIALAEKNTGLTVDQSGRESISKLIDGLDEESTEELRKFLKYLQARQTLSPGSDESSAGLEVDKKGS